MDNMIEKEESGKIPVVTWSWLGPDITMMDEIHCLKERLIGKWYWIVFL